MGRCKPMYGFDAKETECLRRRFYKLKKKEAEWEDVYDFMMWARDSGYEKNLNMGKRDKTLPHGPENSFWLEKGYASERYLQKIRQNCDFCTGCEKRCSVSGLGCKDWRNYFVKNWNEKIYVPPVKPVVYEGPMVFRYEHPDLVREGIVFEGSGSM